MVRTDHDRDTIATMFSRRTQWNLQANELSRLLSRKRQEGVDLLDLTESNPTRCGLDYPASEILSALSDSRSVVYEPEALGLSSARQAVSLYYRERGLNVDPSRIVLTASTSEAYSFLFKLLADPGDRVLIPKPSYPLFDFLTGLESVEVKSYYLTWNGRWQFDFESIHRAIDSRTRAILVVNPNNPTGNYLSSEDRLRLLEICSAKDMALISDEVFLDYDQRDDRPDGMGERSALGACQAFVRHGSSPDVGARPCPDDGALTFSLSGLSKMAGLPQLKLGWIAVGGPASDVAQALDRLEVIADTFLSVNTPVQVALPRLFGAMEPVRRRIRLRVNKHALWLSERCRGQAVRVLPTEAGWYSILEVPRILSEEEWVLTLLREDDLVVHPGYFFDMPREAFLVISLLLETDRFQKGIERLQSRIAHLGR